MIHGLGQRRGRSCKLFVFVSSMTQWFIRTREVIILVTKTFPRNKKAKMYFKYIHKNQNGLKNGDLYIY